MQLLHDYHATLCCLPVAEVAFVVHVFLKSADPNYRRAVVTHDRRLARYFAPFREFVDEAERRRGA